jgi:hypothetical protein
MFTLRFVQYRTTNADSLNLLYCMLSLNKRNSNSKLTVQSGSILALPVGVGSLYVCY